MNEFLDTLSDSDIETLASYSEAELTAFFEGAEAEIEQSASDELTNNFLDVLEDDEILALAEMPEDEQEEFLSICEFALNKVL
jgi:predicted 3-demethylubiquinone-9 3-methyltransferase (glyoxalase superfamily)